MPAMHLHSTPKTLLLIAALSINVSFAYGQLSGPEKQRAIASLTDGIETAIRKYESETPTIREKVVGRMSECAFLFKTLGSASPDAELKKSMAVASEVSLEVSVLVAKSMELARYKSVVDAAYTSVIKLTKRQNRKETLLLLRNCKSFNELSGLLIGVAVVSVYFCLKLTRHKTAIPFIAKYVFRNQPMSVTSAEKLFNVVTSYVFAIGGIWIIAALFYLANG